MELQWNKCQGDVWCNLNSVNLGHPHFNSMSGVYIIWHGGSPAATVRVGQGNIRERLATHRTDPAIQKYKHLDLYVTWASVPKASQDGVETYLAQKLSPIVGELFPKAAPISINLPW